MTIREYITGKFSFFDLKAAQIEQIGFGLPLDDEFTIDNAEHVGKAMCDLVEEMVLMPKLSSVNESGFSVSYDFSSLGRYYMYLCRRYDKKTNPEVLALLGVNAVIDRTDIW